MAEIEWLVRLLNINFDMRTVPMDWRGASIMSHKDNISMNVVIREV